MGNKVNSDMANDARPAQAESGGLSKCRQHAKERKEINLKYGRTWGLTGSMPPRLLWLRHRGRHVAHWIEEMKHQCNGMPGKRSAPALKGLCSVLYKPVTVFESVHSKRTHNKQSEQHYHEWAETIGLANRAWESLYLWDQ